MGRAGHPELGPWSPTLLHSTAEEKLISHSHNLPMKVLKVTEELSLEGCVGFRQRTSQGTENACPQTQAPQNPWPNPRMTESTHELNGERRLLIQEHDRGRRARAQVSGAKFTETRKS